MRWRLERVPVDAGHLFMQCKGDWRLLAPSACRHEASVLLICVKANGCDGMASISTLD